MSFFLPEIPLLFYRFQFFSSNFLVGSFPSVPIYENFFFHTQNRTVLKKTVPLYKQVSSFPYLRSHHQNQIILPFSFLPLFVIVYSLSIIHTNTFIIMRQLFFLYYLLFSVSVFLLNIFICVFYTISFLYFFILCRNIQYLLTFHIILRIIVLNTF